MKYSNLIPTIITTLSLLFSMNIKHLQAQDNADFLQIRSKYQTAVDSMELESIIKLEDRFNDFPDDHRMAPFARYYAGLAHYRLNTMFDQLSKKRRDKHLDQAQKMLEKAVELRSEFPDAYALSAGVYGMKSTGMFSGMKYGPKSESAMDKALAQNPDNPRVRMLNGVGLLNKPSMFGGSVTGAIEEFKVAGDLFTTYEPENEYLPTWGHAENYAWLGQAYEQNKQPEKAKQAYEKALAINPNYQWVKKVLLPELISSL
ncbi:MAG: tetratricopeptide repeat protein [Bacteroidetes bacterium]|jgi:tetratricopeptide (TPR) repeat protein|nr:tetratricopeptide repeat protein [Bacteroidota bacterium]